MPIYVYHGGDGSAPTTGFATGYTSIENANVLGAAAGTEIWVASDHVEQKTSAHFVIAFTNGTVANPIRVLSIKRADNTYETMATGGGKIETLGSADDITLTGEVVWIGCRFIAKDFLYINTSANGMAQFIDCLLDATDDIALSTNVEAFCAFINCTLYPRDGIAFGSDSYYDFIGCTFANVLANGHFKAVSNFRTVTLENCDLSAEADIIIDLDEGQKWVFRRCKLANSFVLFGGAVLSVGSTVLVESCISGTSTDAILGMQQWHTYYGNVVAETTTYRSGGASDGTTAYSWKMTSNASALEYFAPLKTTPITRWVASGSQTLTIHINHEAVGGGTAGDLQDDEIWLEVSSPNEASSLGRRRTTLPATIRTTPSDLTNNSETWNSAKSVKQQLSVSITPTEAGPVTVYVCLGKPSVIVYVDPKIEVS